MNLDRIGRQQFGDDLEIARITNRHDLDPARNDGLTFARDAHDAARCGSPDRYDVVAVPILARFAGAETGARSIELGFPRAHLIRYHGVFAPNSALRGRVVAKPKAAASVEPAPKNGAHRSSLAMFRCI